MFRKVNELDNAHLSFFICFEVWTKEWNIFDLEIGICAKDDSHGQVLRKAMHLSITKQSTHHKPR